MKELYTFVTAVVLFNAGIFALFIQSENAKQKELSLKMKTNESEQMINTKTSITETKQIHAAK